MLRKKMTSHGKLFEKQSWKSWLIQYKMFMILFAPVFLLFMLMAVKFSLKTSHLESEFLKAQKAYSQLETSDSLETTALKTLKSLLKKHPELKGSYEPMMIQKMISFGQQEQVEWLLASFLKRDRPITYYTDFANTSLHIEKGELAGALFEALALKENMLTDSVFWKHAKDRHYGSTLFAFNLLRIAMLSQSLEKHEEELMAWRELKQYAKWDPQGDKNLPPLDTQAFTRLLKHFTHQSISLKEYIKHRETQIVVGKKKYISQLAS
jgi:hypothetical protein